MAGPPDLGNVNDFLVTESGRIEKRFPRQARARGIWSNQIRQGNFPLAMGQVITVARFDRSNPNTPFTWGAINDDTGTGSNVNLAQVEIDPAWDTFQFQLYGGAVNSNVLTIHDLAVSNNGPQQVANIVKNLQDNVLDIWEDRKQDEYDRISNNKRVCLNGTYAQTGYNQGYSATPATSQLNLEFLEDCWDDMMRQGGAQGDWGSLEYVQGQPCPLVFISPEGQRSIFRQNIDHRKDLRYSSQADRLVNPLTGGDTGKKDIVSIRNPNIQSGGAFGHFRYGMNIRAPRYNFLGGQYVRVPYYSSTPAAIGNAANPGAAYKTARYEVAYVFHPGVMEFLMYHPSSSGGSGVQFQNAQFMGKFRWKNTEDNTVNLDGQQGYFRALLASASRPWLPELGYSFLYCRNSSIDNTIGCLGS